MLRRALGTDGAEQRGAQVAVAAVGQQGNDGAALHVPRRTQGPCHGGAARHADEDPLPSGQQPGRFKGLPVIHGHFLIEQIRVVDSRDYGLGHVLESLDAVARR